MIEIVRQNARFPAWSEIKTFSLHDIALHAERLVAIGHRGRIFVTSGTCQVRQDSRSHVLLEGQFLALEKGAVMLTSQAPAKAVVFDGTWGDEMGGCGFLRIENVALPADRGDLVTYLKRTTMDSHYHDCQEAVLLLEGEATLVVDGQHLKLKPGDCVPIPMGATHDLPDAPKPVRAIFFETTLRGQKRTGHLWQHTHGPAIREKESVG